MYISEINFRKTSKLLNNFPRISSQDCDTDLIFIQNLCRHNNFYSYSFISINLFFLFRMLKSNNKYNIKCYAHKFRIKIILNILFIIQIFN